MKFSVVCPIQDWSFHENFDGELVRLPDHRLDFYSRHHGSSYIRTYFIYSRSKLYIQVEEKKKVLLEKEVWRLTPSKNSPKIKSISK